jgi:hypothetical protein
MTLLQYSVIKGGMYGMSEAEHIKREKYSFFCSLTPFASCYPSCLFFTLYSSILIIFFYFKTYQLLSDERAELGHR